MKPPKLNKLLFWQIALLGCTFIIISILGTVAMVKYTERPVFCTTCHIMRPYYQAWKTSKHNKVHCVECHFEPGVQGTIRGKFQAINQLTKYVTRMAGPHPRAEIPDKSCLRSGCHSKRLIKSKVKFGKIIFNHRPHMLSLRRGKRLRCTSCHSQIMIGTHMAVTPSTCFLCHFKDMPQGHAVGGCTACHTLPKKDIVFQNMRFNHKEYIKEGAACDECHLNVTRGSGNVQKDRCVNCHAEPERLAKITDSAYIHRKHVTEHKVECMQCHDEIEHGATKMRSSLSLQCNNCHGNLHTAQRDIFAGTGGRGVTGVPSPMFLAGVNCEGCHIVKQHNEKSRFVGTALAVKEISCIKCHGPGVDGILPTWTKYLDGRMASFTALLSQATAKVSKTATTPEAVKARKLLSDATYNHNLLRYGHGEHNIEYSRALIDGSEDMLRAAMNPAYTPKKIAPSNAVSCTQLCHINPPTRAIRFQGKTFPHGRHIGAKELKCTDCHSAETHKLTKITAKNCDSCHHDKFKQDCLRCHKQQLGKVTSYKGRKFPHSDHSQKSKLACDECHISDKNSRLVFRQDCVTCHTKKKPASHVASWRGNLHGKASQKKDASCSNCHKQPFCSGCHRLNMPHPEGWAGKQHGELAYKDKVLCRNCHTQKDCLDCHTSKAKPASGVHKDCKGCHDQKTWKFLGASHTCRKCHKDHVSSKAPARHKECIGCHEPHTWKPVSVPTLCAKCHPQQVKLSKTVSGMEDCEICHNPHTWKFEGTDACYGCHDNVQKDIGKSKLMPDCMSCHPTHSWKIKKIGETCSTCHQKMPGHEGDGFANCTDCHTPHTWKP